MFFRIFQHLLPVSRAWRLTYGTKIRDFFNGLTDLSDDVKLYLDLVWLDVMPDTTRELTAWETQFGLASSDLTEQERRDRLTAAWQAVGGQDPRYLQDSLKGAGFDVYVHEWWESGSEPAIGSHSCATPRDPVVYLTSDRKYINECGEVVAECGELRAECGEFEGGFAYLTMSGAPGALSGAPGALSGAGAIIGGTGYPLVNKIKQTIPLYIAECGELIAECGELIAECGEFDGLIEGIVEYAVPNDPSKWPYFIYIGGSTFGTLANIPKERQDEFEDLCLKLRPLQQWLGILVNYT